MQQLSSYKQTLCIKPTDCFVQSVQHCMLLSDQNAAYSYSKLNPKIVLTMFETFVFIGTQEKSKKEITLPFTELAVLFYDWQL